MKKYKEFLNEKYDQNYINNAERYVAQLCEDKLIEEIDKIIPIEKNNNKIDVDPYGEENWSDNLENLHPVIINILNEFYWRWNWREASIEEIKVNISGFVHNYILDDGELSINLIEDRLVRTAHRPNMAYDNNLTHIGGSLHILEKLGYKIQCIVLSRKRENNEVLAKCNSWSESAIEFNRIKKEMNIDETHCRYDMCWAPDKFYINIIPIVPV